MKEMVSLVKWKKVQRQDQSEHVTPLDNLSVYIYERGSVSKIPGVFSISFDGILKTQNYMENKKKWSNIGTLTSNWQNHRPYHRPMTSQGFPPLAHPKVDLRIDYLRSERS